jgi:hypothetical protein
MLVVSCWLVYVHQTGLCCSIPEVHTASKCVHCYAVACTAWIVGTVPAETMAKIECTGENFVALLRERTIPA